MPVSQVLRRGKSTYTMSALDQYTSTATEQMAFLTGTFPVETFIT